MKFVSKSHTTYQQIMNIFEIMFNLSIKRSDKEKNHNFDVDKCPHDAFILKIITFN